MKNLGRRQELNPGPLASATSALTTELRQPSTSKTVTFFYLVCMKGQNLIIVQKTTTTTTTTTNIKATFRQIYMYHKKRLTRL